ncbi:cyclin-dependent kinase 4 [Acyrthosiphon pisum]|uniref:cyclin-dependent kinase n=1 Tax=Acyrthosiphon pisum TaxID=7029 RepID=A0A8R2F7W7_ACYPI|nr:cyclin-dependent kinase 4 [Acyrthosiphon pisum]XP_008182746.1 cyclin-dependent kinase 4 [Acyrthosiphon pisum]XP_016659610.1 cyclin-dependent kinase 4 [Acyrthosiphon pisum]|eukprot:XP_001947810.2 PREDICTED: cyclin-dependent kinase 4 [Acyrthosiphon pisum]
MCVPRNPPEVPLRLLLIRRHRLRLRRKSPSPSGFSRCHPIAKPFATGRRCPQVVATRPSRSVSRTLRCETILSPRVRCILYVQSARHLLCHLVPILLKPAIHKLLTSTVTTMVSPLSRLQSKTFPAMSSMLQEKENYEELNQIGNGAYGTVYKGRDLVNKGKFVAMKKIKIPLAQDGVPMTTLREIALLKQLDQQQHPNIVKLLDVVHGPRLYNEKCMTLYLVFEHIEQDLATYMARCPKPGMSSEIIKNVMRQILSGVDFLHCNRVVHRDLKPQNVLVSSDLRIKIADFGLAKIYDFDMKLTSVVVTLWYRAPEVLLGLPYATAVDVWACGCIMGEMYKLSPLFDGESEAEQLDRIFRVIGLPSALNWPKNVSLLRSSFESYPQTCLKTVIPDICSKGTDLLMKMLMFDSTERVSAREALKHPYFNET